MLLWASVVSAGPSGASPSSLRTRFIASAPTPLCERARTKASFIASTSSWEIAFTLRPAQWTWLFISTSVVAFFSFTSPALYLPEDMAWNCLIEMLTLSRLIGMVLLLC